MGRYLSDTAPEAERVLIRSIRAMPSERKWRVWNGTYRTGRKLHEAGFRSRHPDATPDDVLADWFRWTLGPLARTVPRGRPEMTPIPEDPTRLVREVMTVFDALGIAAAVGGSIASSLHGVPRYTQDADLTAEPFPGLEAEFCGRFGADYYVSVDAVRAAVRDRSTFNIIHTGAGYKVDVFVRRDRPFEVSLMARRAPYSISDSEGPLVLVSAEDIVLLKLEWYRLGGEVSDRQWIDVVNVLKVRGTTIDDRYLDLWADSLGVADLLAEARAEAREIGF